MNYQEPRIAFPKTLPEQVSAVLKALKEIESSATAETIARKFTRARKGKIEPILETLVTFGQARKTDSGMFVSSQ